MTASINIFAPLLFVLLSYWHESLLFASFLSQLSFSVRFSRARFYSLLVLLLLQDSQSTHNNLFPALALRRDKLNVHFFFLHSFFLVHFHDDLELFCLNSLVQRRDDDDARECADEGIVNEIHSSEVDWIEIREVVWHLNDDYYDVWLNCRWLMLTRSNYLLSCQRENVEKCQNICVNFEL